MNNNEIKKKRGRKPKNYKESEEELKKKNDELNKTPKKRGRKPKIKTNDENSNKFVLPSKRGRKPKEKNYGFNTNYNNNNNNNNINNMFILHLPISFNKIKHLISNEPYSYDPNISIPVAYDPYLSNENFLDNNNNIHNQHIIKNEFNQTEEKKKEININNNQQENIINSNYSTNMLVQFSEYSKKYNVMPDETKYKCFWCLHNFINKVYSLPIKYYNNKFEMFGNFCSPQCVVAYNFNNINDENAYERYSYINFIYNNGYKIYSAPSRESLNYFGGPLSIEQFRTIVDNNYNTNILLPPLISIIPQLEVYKNNINNNEKEFIPLNNDRIEKYKELKLKRTKPIIDHKNTLDHSLKLIYI